MLGTGTGYALAKVLGVDYSLKDAAIDFALGTIGVGIASKLDKAKGARQAMRTTIHGAERLDDVTRLARLEAEGVMANATRRYTQRDGAQVFVQEVGGRFNVVVYGERGLITNLKTVRESTLTRLGRNYGWEPR